MEETVRSLLQNQGVLEQTAVDTVDIMKTYKVPAVTCSESKLAATRSPSVKPVTPVGKVGSFLKV